MSNKLAEFNKEVAGILASKEAIDITKLSYAERLELAKKFPHMFYNKEIRQRELFNNCGNYSRGIYF